MLMAGLGCGRLGVGWLFVVGLAWFPMEDVYRTAEGFQCPGTRGPPGEGGVTRESGGVVGEVLSEFFFHEVDSAQQPITLHLSPKRVDKELLRTLPGTLQSRKH